MTLRIATILHILLIMGQAANALSKILPIVGAVIPIQYQAEIAVALAGIQAAVGWLQHNANPDGTPASVPYLPK